MPKRSISEDVKSRKIAEDFYEAIENGKVENLDETYPRDLEITDVDWEETPYGQGVITLSLLNELGKTRKLNGLISTG